ncbi:iron-containing alcohol dehydrogenase family protein, partial [Vibrio parahaemolyticus V-223/04]
QQVWTR